MGATFSMILPQAKILEKYVRFNGGLDEVTPPWDIPSGTAKSSQNIYQGINGGWETFQGYEAFNGEAAPSAAIHALLDVTITGTILVGDTIEQGIVSAVVLLVGNGFLVITKATGTFAVGAIEISAVEVGTAAGAQRIDAGDTARLRAYYKNIAADSYRADISAIPGSGTVLGVWMYKDKWYGFRNNAGGTAVDMYVESSSGWTQVNLGRELAFTSGGTYEIVAGNTITGATSTATAVVTKVILVSGTFAGGDAVGRIFFASQTGTFQPENLNVGANVDVATIAGNSSAITFAVPSGRFKFGNYNFTGSAGTLKMYGVDGKNRGFEYDGTTFVPINTGMAADTPTNLANFKGHLCYSFGPSFQHSAPGFPYVWSAVIGAGEIALGDNITGFHLLPGFATGGALGIFSQDSTNVLYGTSVDDWNLVSYNNEVGAIANSIQQIGRTYFASTSGIIDLSTSQSFGNFQDSIVSAKVEPFLRTRLNQITASCIVRAKNQYWVFFEDKTAICATVINGAVSAIMPMRFAHKVTCISSCETTTGQEEIMFGSTDGVVRQLYKGTSFDGEDIEWFAELANEHFNGPLVDKRYRTGTLEVKGDGYAEFYFSYEISYGDSDKLQPLAQNKVLSLSGSSWDSFYWDSFYWDGKALTPSRFPMRGIGNNISLVLRSKSDFYSPIKISGIIFQYTPLRVSR